ncbi:tRNA 4-thiouridine(8) synthase ThiI [Pueribacillus theae]|uniref:Probable tRNA sulfurtransferase n=1 Tax=Pueribacillus theae TaxID=2171751 RepID=A0A2U1K0Y6_9BACI|nr:tRNA uracil 4-sulfurtransferase ThiI [Pueribacillus theae]PWA11147.1 tRNA 4-thiouridine(8) synthase ThiI [Pueribacillus theae]
MEYDHILIRYGEIALKGKNRRSFEEQLRRNIKPLLKDYPNARLKRAFDRLYILLNGENYEPIVDRLKKVFGIQSLSVAIKAENGIEAIKEASLAALQKASHGKKTFKVSARRRNKNFPIDSQALNQLIGAHLLRNTDSLTVDVHHPDIDLRVEVKGDGTYISCIQIKGAGGLPVGSAGKVMLMLSGGIDSPVAGYLAMKRGVRLEAVHFHSPPFTSERAKKKVEDLTQKLCQYGGKIQLHIVPFTVTQQEIKKNVPDNYSMTIMRRMMLRVTEELARKRGALAIATGESLGQVASQTIESMHTINAVTNMPILRPLISMDKVEIMDIAHKIDTYEISIRPYEDCCTIFLPTAPKTKPKLDRAMAFEQSLDIEKLVEDAVNGTETFTFSREVKSDQKFEELF